ncbi:MAG: hypothetical protein WCP52_13055 [Bacteroidota bacterium]
MKKISLFITAIFLLIGFTKASAQIKYEEPHFKFDKTKNASLHLTDLNEDLELRAPGQPITVLSYSIIVNIDGKEKTIESNGSKLGKKAVDAIMQAREKPSHIDFSKVSFTQQGDNSKQEIKGFTIFLK